MWNGFRDLFSLLKRGDSFSVLYFWDRSQTKIHRIESRKALTWLSAAVILASIALWALIYSIFSSYHTRQLESQLVSSKSKLFQALVQHEDVFEKVYSKVPKTLLSEANPSPPPPLVKIDVSHWQDHFVSPEFGVRKASMVSTSEGDTIIDLSILNKSKSRISGYAWGLAIYEDEQGQVSFEGFPQDQVILDNAGNIMDLSLASTFRFRKRWDYSVRFAANKSKTIKNFVIVMKNKNGENLSHFSFKPFRANPTTDLQSH